jgi:peptidoglycan/LPS O-acetylase OafA/YrhL
MARMVESRFPLSDGSRWLLWLWGVIFALAVAWAFDRWIDTPVQSAMERLLVKRSSAEPARQEA